MSDLAAARARAEARRWQRIALATSILVDSDLEERMTPDERLALAILARELGAAMDAATATPARIIPFRRHP